MEKKTEIISVMTKLKNSIQCDTVDVFLTSLYKAKVNKIFRDIKLKNKSLI